MVNQTKSVIAKQFSTYINKPVPKPRQQSTLLTEDLTTTSLSNDHSIIPQTQDSKSGSTVEFIPPVPSGIEQVMKDGKVIEVKTRNQCITAMEHYKDKDKSVEELRLEDYEAGRHFGHNSQTTESSVDQMIDCSNNNNVESENLSTENSLVSDDMKSWLLPRKREGKGPDISLLSVPPNSSTNQQRKKSSTAFIREVDDAGPSHSTLSDQFHQQNNVKEKPIVPGLRPYSQAHDQSSWLSSRERVTSVNTGTRHRQSSFRNNNRSGTPPPHARTSITVNSHPNTHAIPTAHSTFTRPPPQPKENLKLFIASSSITKGIDYRRFNECFEFGNAWIQKWPGGRAKHIKNYIQSHLDEEKPDIVLVQAGGNDLAEENRAPIDIAHDVIEIATKAKDSGVQDIFIGGIPIRSRQFTKKRWHELNNALQSLCNIHNFVYIDNSDIKLDHLYDGVHLKDEGTVILADNYLKALRLKYGDSQ